MSPVAPPRTLGALAVRLSATLEGSAAAGAEVADLADDSRRVRPGDVFFARRGAAEDGRRWARDAIQRGACAVVADASLPDDLPMLRVTDVDAALRRAADAFLGRPQDALDLVGITGTKGKTTTAYLAAAALSGAGRKAALLGTIAHDLGDGAPIPAANTTPGALELRRMLARARDAGCTAAVMEVSSHALDQGRTEGLRFAVGVFTNLASDHLDYHATPEAYFEAKARLFDALPPGATAILNREDEAWTRLVRRCRGPVLTYGGAPEADLQARDLSLALDHTAFRLVVAGDGQVDVRSPLVGRHNAMNLLAAVGAATALGVDPIVAAEGASALAAVPGRLQRVAAEDLTVFVDYAHTDDALMQVLTFLRSVGAQPLTCVVGCGGGRDRSKRPRMARVAAELADRAVLTSDNPRDEDPEAILADMLRGVAVAEPTTATPAATRRAERRSRVTALVDRREAIHRAVLEAPPGSTVLVAGKGHERYQIVGDERLPFDDVAEVEDALSARAARRGARSPR